MSTEKQLDEILAELGREHRAIGAPPRLESLLRNAAGSREYPVGAARFKLAWTWAVVAMLLIAVTTAGVFWGTRKHSQTQDRQSRSTPVPQARPEPTLRQSQVPGLQSKSAPPQRPGTKRAGHPEPSPRSAPWGSLDEFVPLPVSEGLPAAAELSVIRIKLRGSDLQQYGLEAPADAIAQTMLAEFVVGEDGLPRAIRIVQ